MSHKNGERGPISDVAHCSLGGEIAEHSRAMETPNKGIRTDSMFISFLVFADDLILIAQEGHQTKEMYTEIQIELSDLGLQINEDKLAYIFG